MSGHNLAHDQITPLVRVSTGAVHYDGEYFSERWQIETWIFSDDPRQANRQVIHGDAWSKEDASAGRIADKARHVHARIADNMRRKFS